MIWEVMPWLAFIELTTCPIGAATDHLSVALIVGQSSTL
jgi:hypothetical protein